MAFFLRSAVALASLACLSRPAAASCDDAAQLEPQIGAVVHLTRDLRVGAWSVVSTEALPDGRVQLELAVEAVNVGPVAYVAATADLSAPVGLDVEVLDGHASFDELPSGAAVVGWDTITIAFAPARRTAVRRALQRVPLTFRGVEDPQYRADVVLLDEETDLAQTAHVDDAGVETFTFSGWTPALLDLRPGSILADAPDYHPVNVDCAELPIRIASITEDAATGEIALVRDPTPIDAFDLFSSFAVKDDWAAGHSREDTPGGAPVTSCALDDPGETECVVPAPQLRFEGLELAPGVLLDGMLATTAHGSAASAWFRDGRPAGMALDVSLDGWVTLQPRVEAGASALDAYAEILSWDAPLASVPVGSGVTLSVSGTFTLEGALRGDLAAGVGVGVTEHVEIGGTLLTDRYGTVFVPHATASAPLLSPPTIDDAVDVDLDAGFRLGIGLEGTASVSGVPMIGATLEHTTRAGQRLVIDPTADVWWTRSDTLEQSAHVSAEVLGFTVFDGEVPIGGREAPLDESAPAAPAAPGERAETELRWSVTGDLDGPYDDGSGDLAVLADGRVAVLGWNTTTDAVAVLEPDGTLAWQTTIDGMAATVLAATDDGGLVVAGDTSVARLDGDGALVWSAGYDIAGLDFVNGVAFSRDAAGEELVVLVGGTYAPTLQPYALALDGAGGLRWAKRYPGPGWQQSAWYDASFARDGDLLVSGSTNAESYAGEINPVNAAVVRLDALTGEPRWGIAVESLAFLGIAELASGDLIAVGDKASTLFDQNHAMVVASITADGALEWITTYAEDVTIEGRAVNRQESVPGDTLWDVATDVVAAGDGFTLVGTSGQYDENGAWLVHLTADGAPVWWTTWDGPGREVLTSLADTGIGYAVLGTTSSFGEDDLLVAHVPYEGSVPGLDPLALDVRYTQPDVDDFAMDDPQPVGFVGDDALPFDPMPVDVVPVLTPGGPTLSACGSTWTAR